jgi:peptidoglycan/LPS O-acetylase OafA/YrhL
VTLTVPQAAYLAPLPLAYVTIFLGLQNPPRTKLIAGADYSYGVYLYGFPVQQAISLLFPEYRVWWFNLGCALLVAGGLAFLSWTLVESQVLKHRKTVLAWVGNVKTWAVRPWVLQG